MRKDPLARRVGPIVAALLLIVLSARSARGQEVTDPIPDADLRRPVIVAPVVPVPSVTSPLSPSSMSLPDLSKPQTFGSALQIVVLLTVLSLAPAILIMTTSFTRIIIVLSLLRQALGTAQLPPNQILMGLALFMTFLVMGPTWQRINNEALQPYLHGDIPDQRVALDRAVDPLRQFMINQIRRGNNDDDVLLFTDAAHQKPPKSWNEVGTFTLIPAFMLSELKTAFYLGFKVYLPFLIVDMVISSVLISMGMMMLPPALISLPFKLLLFVLVDGWRLITGSLMGSFMS
jgi:flagellar biosynthetic protein FliP